MSKAAGGVGGWVGGRAALQLLNYNRWHDSCWVCIVALTKPSSFMVHNVPATSVDCIDPRAPLLRHAFRLRHPRRVRVRHSRCELVLRVLSKTQNSANFRQRLGHFSTMNTKCATNFVGVSADFNEIPSDFSDVLANA